MQLVFQSKNRTLLSNGHSVYSFLIQLLLINYLLKHKQ